MFLAEIQQSNLGSSETVFVPAVGLCQGHTDSFTVSRLSIAVCPSRPLKKQKPCFVKLHVLLVILQVVRQTRNEKQCSRFFSASLFLILDGLWVTLVARCESCAHALLSEAARAAALDSDGSSSETDLPWAASLPTCSKVWSVFVFSSSVACLCFTTSAFLN